MIRKILALVFLFSSLCLNAQSYMHRLEIVLQEGDFIFQDLDCELCEAIEAVTQGYEGYNFSHVGLVKRRGDIVLIGEAINEDGVVWTPLSDFVDRCRNENGIPQLLVMRLRQSYQSFIPSAIEFITANTHRAYDPIYTYGDERYYCSELLYDAFLSGDSSLFNLEPMTFKKPATDRYFPAWIRYFEQLGHPIPEGAPGINPGGMSTFEGLKAVFVIGLEK